MSLLRIGHEFTPIADGYRVELEPEQAKTAKYDVFTLPKSLIPYVDRYLATVRPALLRASRPAVSRRQPLSERCVNLSIHTAPIRQTCRAY